MNLRRDIQYIRNFTQFPGLLGTVFVINKFSKNGRYFLTLMTAGHVIDDIANPTKNSRYEGVQIYKDFSKKVGPANPLHGTLLKGTIISSEIDSEKDIGSILYEVIESTYQSIQPLQIATEGCALQTEQSLEPGSSLTTVVVGFPGVHIRSIENQNTKIE